jgi:hypothetical protein
MTSAANTKNLPYFSEFIWESKQLEIGLTIGLVIGYVFWILFTDLHTEKNMLCLVWPNIDATFFSDNNAMQTFGKGLSYSFIWDNNCMFACLQESN